jgi:hypothetical protein
MAISKAVYGLYLSADHDIKTERDFDGRACGRAELYVVKIGEKDEITNDSYGPFNDLAFYCQWNEKMEEGKPFAWAVEYRKVYTVDFSNCERMLKVLRKARAVKYPVDPTTFGQFCALMARHLGITKFVVCRESFGSSYADKRHSIFDIRDAQHVIDRAIREAYEKQVPTTLSMEVR